MSGRRRLPQCSHGLSDSADLTYRHVVEDLIRGTKVTVFGYWCHEHGRHGSHRIHQTVEKLELRERAEP